ncbi:hypothetical protein ACRYCC_23545 [Actinomadura scrupuli]|uniref:hypothetical protein n=1 Tax=Actinomadura scrupuli TaxID=559629 RepID=UPI003D981EF6
MGMFKQFKDMVGMVNEAPSMIAEAQKLQQNAQQQAQQAQQFQAGAGFGGSYAAVPQAADVAAGDPRLAPVEGVTLERYAQVSKVAATQGLDQAGLAGYVRSLGIDSVVWTRATETWNARFKGDMQLATQFGRLYQQAQV